MYVSQYLDGGARLTVALGAGCDRHGGDPRAMGESPAVHDVRSEFKPYQRVVFKTLTKLGPPYPETSSSTAGGLLHYRS